MLCFWLAFVHFVLVNWNVFSLFFCRGRKSGIENWTEAYRSRTEICGFVQSIRTYLRLAFNQYAVSSVYKLSVYRTI